MFRPQRVLITRSSNDNEPMQHEPGVVTSSPSVGESLQLWLDTGKWMRTSPVTKIEHEGQEIVVDTKNSRYRLQLAA